tara:strand:- start:274 stop:414 length:141 start_codon:yes stop_codon:yes gene_type:complete
MSSTKIKRKFGLFAESEVPFINIVRQTRRAILKENNLMMEYLFESA